MEERKEIMKRQVAYKLMISQVLAGSYKKAENEPNHLIVDDKFKISRVNVMGIIIELDKNEDSSYKSFFIDDSSGKISVRIFEGNELKDIGSLDAGDPVLVIGKPRLYGNDIYIVPEIIKKVDSMWLKVHQAEINSQDLSKIAEITQIKANKDDDTNMISELIPTEEEILEDNDEEIIGDPYTKYLTIIKDLDKKDGAPTQEVIEKIDLLGDDGEKIVDKLLKEGEIFEIKAGKIKILG